MPNARTSQLNTGKPRRWLVLFGIVITLMAVGLQLLNPPQPHKSSVLSRVEAMWYDWRFQLWPPQRDSGIPIIVVDLDEATQQREGRWPWNRAKVADLIHALQGYGVAIIGFDVVFSEPGSNPATEMLSDTSLSPSVRQEITKRETHFDGDAKLAQVLTDNTVLGYFLHADGGKSGQLPLPFLQLPEGSAPIKGIFSMPDYTASLAQFSDHALASGFVVAIPDADGIVRRMPLLMQYGDGIYSALSLEIARLALGAPWIRLESEQHGDAQLLTGLRVGRSLRIPVDNSGGILIPYKGGAKSYPTLSATGVLRGDAPSNQLEQLQGAVVLVGTSALGLGDLRTTPLQTAYPGVEVHANVVDTLLYAAMVQADEAASQRQSPFYQQPDWVSGANALIVLLSGLLLSFLLPGRSPLVMLLASGGWFLLALLVNIVAWYRWHFAFPIAMQGVVVLVLGGLNIAAGYFITNRQKRTIQTLFGEYVPAAHVTAMLERPDRISLEGEQREMTVLFADVRNFTAMSEALSANALKEVLNRYLSAVTEVIFQHNGTIDKYVGDLVMAFWNAPLPDQQHASHAVAAALAMQQRMHHLRQAFAKEGLPQFHIGIGINTGLMNVGDMGSQYRRAYTVLGDAVNLASRLEGLTDFYQLPVLVSDTTMVAAPDFSYRTIDRVRVKGRHAPLNIYQPLGELGHYNATKEGLTQHERAVVSYQQGKYDAALRQFHELSHRYPNDSLYQMYINRLSTYSASLGKEGWDPVYDHETK